MDKTNDETSGGPETRPLRCVCCSALPMEKVSFWHLEQFNLGTKTMDKQKNKMPKRRKFKLKRLLTGTSTATEETLEVTKKTSMESLQTSIYSNDVPVVCAMYYRYNKIANSLKASGPRDRRGPGLLSKHCCVGAPGKEFGNDRVGVTGQDPAHARS
jgi:hypothetical protein